MNPGQKKSEKYQSIFRIIILFLIILAINFIGNFIYKRFDLTKEKRYSLASPSISLLKKLNQRVLIKVYLDGDLPSGFLRLKNSTKDILQEFKAYSNNKIEFEFIDPFKNAKSDAEKKQFMNSSSIKDYCPPTSN
ncbi:MAG: GldG family protein [Bacteroidetes bacterium]|nr:GldG family protein [Bacteroidota bacterium]